MAHSLDVENLVKLIIAQSGIPAHVVVSSGTDQAEGEIPYYADLICRTPEDAVELKNYINSRRPEWAASIDMVDHLVHTTPLVRWNGYKIVEQSFDSVQQIFVDMEASVLFPITGAWYIEALPGCIIIERENGTLGKFGITPFRLITEKDISIYKGYHPRHCKGQPLPDYLYLQYGLVKSSQSLSALLPTIRVRPSELEKLQRIAAGRSQTISELVRSIIRDLPEE